MFTTNELSFLAHITLYEAKHSPYLNQGSSYFAWPNILH